MGAFLVAIAERRWFFLIGVPLLFAGIFAGHTWGKVISLIGVSMIVLQTPITLWVRRRARR